MKMANLAGRVCSETEQYGLMSPLPALTAADDDLDSSAPITGS
jgi:hypothetical protein